MRPSVEERAQYLKDFLDFLVAWAAQVEVRCEREKFPPSAAHLLATEMSIFLERHRLGRSGCVHINSLNGKYTVDFDLHVCCSAAELMCPRGYKPETWPLLPEI